MAVRPIRRLLIANRGEIAVRIATTAHRMGITTVGVYSEADALAYHTDVVDQAVALGGRTPAESYLRANAMLAAAVDTGCDAVHPGYGFLAERADVAAMVESAELAWVGPTAEQIALLGDKVEAKRAALAAGVPTTTMIELEPGEAMPTVEFPVLVKAAAGGGGRGMRVVRVPGELAGAIDSAAREAESAFGDGRVFLEPFLERGRHVEVQIIGDSHGAVVHLGERECSIQRRNQKIIEESPSASITPEQRSALWGGAVALAEHVGYRSAGTVEFMVAEDGRISFLEVNTRLQVEHPVTEAITGLDLVEFQLRIAAGEPLPLTQDEIVFDGHAIEARVVAEDPAAGWLPSVGTVDRFEVGGSAVRGPVRVDRGVVAGSEISPDYDSLLAKVIVHAPTRAEAAQRMARTLRLAEVAGVRTNVDCLQAIVAESDFLAAKTLTTYLEDHPSVTDSAGPEGDDRLALLLGAVFAVEANDRAHDPVTGFAPSGWRNLRTIGQRQRWLLGDEEHAVEYVVDGSQANVLVGPFPEADDDGSLPVDSRRRVAVRLLRREAARQTLEIDGRRHLIDVVLTGPDAHASSRAGALTWTAVPRFEENRAEAAGSGPICPLPGTVLEVRVEVGQVVADGEVLMVIEAMKMEHKILATGDAAVAAVHFGAGDRVDTGDVLVSLEAES